MLYFFFTSRRRHTRCALVTGVQTCALPIFTLTDDGDLPLTEDTAQDDAMIRRHVAYVREDGDIPFALGGDHAVTFPLVEAAAACHGPVTILHFDAHPYLYDHFAGNPPSHAPPFPPLCAPGPPKRPMPG